MSRLSLCCDFNAINAINAIASNYIDIFTDQHVESNSHRYETSLSSIIAFPHASAGGMKRWKGAQLGGNLSEKQSSGLRLIVNPNNILRTT